MQLSAFFFVLSRFRVVIYYSLGVGEGTGGIPLFSLCFPDPPPAGKHLVPDSPEQTADYTNQNGGREVCFCDSWHDEFWSLDWDSFKQTSVQCKYQRQMYRELENKVNLSPDYWYLFILKWMEFTPIIFVLVAQEDIAIECFHGGHVGGLKQWDSFAWKKILFPRGEKMYCFCPPTAMTSQYMKMLYKSFVLTPDEKVAFV